LTEQDEKLAAVRRGVPATERIAFLNAGSHGPLTAAAGAVIARMAEDEVRDGRLGSVHFQRTGELKTATRAEFARVLGCGVEEVALTNSTTSGMNIACWGLNWQSGDEAITTTVEHMGGLSPLYVLESRFGVRVRFAAIGNGGSGLLASIEAGLSDRTRVILVSHVSWSAGIVLPLREIADLAHRAGAFLFVDGAQSGGAIPIDVKALGVDAYAIPGQKWLCGPEGFGALYVSSDRLGEILPSYAGGAAFGTHDLAGHYEIREDATRFNLPGSPFVPALAGMKASLQWFLNDVGAGWAYARIGDNAARCRSLLEAIEGVEVLTPPGRHAGLVHFTVAGWQAGAVEEELRNRDVLVRSMQEPACVRASTGFYNSDGDLEALAAGVQEILRLAPHPPSSQVS
jgi:L-cysteine/cystine lyase